jgi:hypothetical protein
MRTSMFTQLVFLDLDDGSYVEKQHENPSRFGSLRRVRANLSLRNVGHVVGHGRLVIYLDSVNSLLNSEVELVMVGAEEVSHLKKRVSA